MMEVEERITVLCQGKDREAYKAMRELQAESLRSAEAVPYMDTFLAMLGSQNSYVRTRGLVLAAANARWDAENKLDGALEEYLAHIGDEKPITARQCVKALPAIAEAKPYLAPRIRQALLNANTTQYPDSMATLLEKDIAAALNAMSGL